MKALKTILKILAVTVAALVVLGFVAIRVRRDRTFDAPYPQVAASHDPALLARGRYLAYGPGHCVDCHGDPDALAREAGAGAASEIALSGGATFRLPVGTIYVPNITPDAETGIGRFSDRELGRVLRHGVRPDGRAVLPFMAFSDLTDGDLVALLSFLRSLPPVRHSVPAHEPNLLGQAVLAFVLAPQGPTRAVRAEVTPAPTAAYGEYLVHSVANCVGCHTARDLRTGAFTGPLLGGGAVHESLSSPGKRFVAPNLTPDARWGWVASWPEEVFLARFRQGRLVEGSPMPWSAFRNMSDDDLRAIFRYLATVPAAAGGPDPAKRGGVQLADEGARGPH